MIHEMASFWCRAIVHLNCGHFSNICCQSTKLHLPKQTDTDEVLSEINCIIVAKIRAALLYLGIHQ